MPIVALAILVLLAVIALIPVSIVVRFRTAAARRRALGWMATLNLLGVTASAALLLLAALIASRAVPETPRWVALGLGGGAVLGLLGVALTRWEWSAGRLYYRPNRWLGLAISLAVTARVLYGFWRSWEAWRASVDQMTWVAASGIATSMSAGAVILGYYLVFWAGVRRRLTSGTFNR